MPSTWLSSWARYGILVVAKVNVECFGLHFGLGSTPLCEWSYYCNAVHELCRPKPWSTFKSRDSPMSRSWPTRFTCARMAFRVYWVFQGVEMEKNENFNNSVSWISPEISRIYSMGVESSRVESHVFPFAREPKVYLHPAMFHSPNIQPNA